MAEDETRNQRAGLRRVEVIWLPFFIDAKLPVIFARDRLRGFRARARALLTGRVGYSWACGDRKYPLQRTVEHWTDSAIAAAGVKASPPEGREGGRA